MWRDVCDAAIAALPDWAIGLYAGDVPQVREAISRFGDISTNSRMAVRQALGVLDTVFMAEPGVLEARQRIQLRIRAAERAASRLKTAARPGRQRSPAPRFLLLSPMKHDRESSVA